MLDRMVCGEVPAKHHIALRGPDGALLHEECFTRDGFEGPYSILYHLHRPHTHAAVATDHGFTAPVAAEPGTLSKRHFKTFELAPRGGAPVDARVPLVFNEDLVVSVMHPDADDPVYVSNSDGDDLLYVFRGSGVLRSAFGDLRFEQDDYLCIPRGTVHRLLPDADVEQYWLSMECRGGLHLPRQWRNEAGQLRMDAPYSHRDFRRPEFRGPVDEELRTLVVKREDRFHGFALEESPLDVVGWDGSVYPFVFPILAFQPRAGLVHLPPTWHGTFAARGALVCSFVPRLVDFHPEAVPCPYPHSSVDVDELIFYSRGSFTSRRGISPGSISVHPAGLPHGPHPGAYEASIGTDRTDELAVMIDSLRPLRHTAAAADVADAGYHASFREA